MTNPAIPLIFIGAVAVGAEALKLVDYLKLQCLRSLSCPQCHAGFGVPGLARVKRWMEAPLDSTSTGIRSGFYLRCDHCNVDFRFADDYQLLGHSDIEA